MVLVGFLLTSGSERASLCWLKQWVAHSQAGMGRESVFGSEGIKAFCVCVRAEEDTCYWEEKCLEEGEKVIKCATSFCF